MIYMTDAGHLFIYLNKRFNFFVCFNNHYYGWYHLYGHIHNSFEWHIMERIKYEMETLYDKECNMYNVGCMMPYMSYCPRTLGDIITMNDI